MTAEDVFWTDLREELADPEFLRAYVTNWVRITATDAIINELDAAREDTHLTKAALARAINAEPSTLRRLFAASNRPNPTIGTVAEVAAALGLRLTLEPMHLDDVKVTTKSLLTGKVEDADLHTLAESLGAA